MRRVFVAAVLLAMSLTTASAQQEKLLNTRLIEAGKELRQSLLEWARAEVVPELGRWKATLDAGMSSDDLKQLDQLRARASELQKRAIKSATALRQAWKAEDYDAVKTERQALKGMKAEGITLLKEVAPIAIRNRETLEKIGEVAKPTLPRWIQSAKGIVDEWCQKNRGAFGENDGCPAWSMLGNRKWMKMLDPGLRKKVGVAYFMLWDGGDFTRSLEQVIGGGTDDVDSDIFDLK